ncbi:MAG: glycosyl hydrolase family 30, partial [Bacteroidota bacterium]
MDPANDSDALVVTVYETSAAGRQLEKVTDFATEGETSTVQLLPGETHQTITGIGGSFTEASAYLLNQLSAPKRDSIIQAYFGDAGARYSLTRTHINSCDFSLGNYAYAPVAGDTELAEFSVAEDEEDLIPMIKDALAASKDGFKIIASPWTAPPWMKTNNDWRGGQLKPEYREVWARYFVKYLEAYQEHGIDIWGITVENEPLGNDNNWESMHFSPEEMTAFVRDYLGPTLATDWPEVKILGYDQNRGEELQHWVDVMYGDTAAARYFAGTAVHWYASTYDPFGESLRYAKAAAPDKHLIQSEGCVDAQVPVWRDDAWYWSKEATDWGWDWAPEEEKYLHPKYVPVYRYARDLIGCFNNQVDGWVEWNMVLDRQG